MGFRDPQGRRDLQGHPDRRDKRESLGQPALKAFLESRAERGRGSSGRLGLLDLPGLRGLRDLRGRRDL